MRLAAGLLAIASLIAAVDGQMNLYDPNDDALDHVQPNKPHADALRQLRRSLPSDPHGMMRWWEGDEPCKMPWRGIRCEGGNGVTHIDMNNRGLGWFIDPAIGLIDTLREINLGNNFISNNIPGEAIANLTKLEVLNVHNNRLNGFIPQSLGNSTSLVHIGLSRNLMVGPIPKELGKIQTLVSLDLNMNFLNGTIPVELGDCIYLAELNLGKNRLTGEIPPGLIPEGRVSKLVTLRLNGNMLENQVPATWGSQLRYMQILDLSRNWLIGDVPPALADIPNLRELWLSHNTWMRGETPSVLTNKGLQVLVR